MTDPADRAFGVPETEYNDVSWGLTKREYMATQIMAGMCALTTRGCDDIAAAAVARADALIEVLNRKE